MHVATSSYLTVHAWTIFLSYGILCRRAYCLKPFSEQYNDQSSRSLLWIPPKLLDVALRDSDLSSHFFGHLIKGGLFPAKMHIKDAAQHFAAIYLQANTEVRRALCLHFSHLSRHKGLQKYFA